MGRSDGKGLAGIKLLEGLEGSEVRRLESRCHWRHCVAGQHILDNASPCREVYFVVEGAVRVVNYSISGREVALAMVSTGDYFGELAAIDQQPRSASVVAIEDSLLAILPPEDFLDLVQRRVEVTFRVLERLAHIIRADDERILELSTVKAMHRVYAEVLRMAEPDRGSPGGWVIRAYPPERDIASRVGTTRETVARAMAQLRRSHLVRRRNHDLQLLDRARIEEIVSALQIQTEA